MVAVRAFAWLTIVGRGGGFSATCTAPPPMTAPPQVQAQSFARAILTDIISILFLAGLSKGLDQCSCAAWPCGQMQSRLLRGKHVNHLVARKGRVLGRASGFRPITEHDRIGSERRRRFYFCGERESAAPSRCSPHESGPPSTRPGASRARPAALGGENFSPRLSDLCLHLGASIGRAGAGGLNFRTQCARAKLKVRSEAATPVPRGCGSLR